MTQTIYFLSAKPVLVLFCLANHVLPSLGQSNQQFQWAFTDGNMTTSIPTCTPLALSITVNPFNSNTNAVYGTPPYYMIAFAVAGTPQTAFIGTDKNNLSWTTTQPVGSLLILKVVDSMGSTGGVLPQLWAVTVGPSEQCVIIPPSTAPGFTVTANVTTILETCQPWGLTVKGGVSPYVLTLAQADSPALTNVTMPNGLDQFTFINRAKPNSAIVAGISDSTGRWAAGTPLVNTNGSADVSCPGLVSSSGNATLIQKQQNAANARVQATKRKHLIVVVVTLILLLVAGIVGVVFYHLPKRKREDQEAKPHHYLELEMEAKTISINENLQPTSSGSNQNQNQPMSRKAAIIMAIQNATRANGVQENRSVPPSQSSSTSTTAPLLSAGAGLPDGPAAGEAVFQHQDVGVVRELPPPYTDQLRLSQAASS